MGPMSFYGNNRWSSRYWVYFLNLLIHIMVISAYTNPQDAAALSALTSSWENKPSNWITGDPCGDGWVGITCTNNRVVSIILSGLGISGTLSGDIQYLLELQTLDLSYNKGLTGALPSSIGSLSKLEKLILIGCSFSGPIPPEISSLKRLVNLSLNSNRFTGSIPASIGDLSKLYWLDLADNKLTGTIPVSPGLDMLTHTKHFHFSINQLSGSIPSQLFSSDMRLIHLLFDNNKFSGKVPSTLGLVKTLEAVRFDGNSLTGLVPGNLSSLTSVVGLHLSNNKFSGPLPDLTGMSKLSYVDLSNNSFDASDVPSWFSTLPSLTTLFVENLRIGGKVPTALFSLPSLQTAKLRNNRFNGTLDIGTKYSNQLELVDLQDNDIDEITLGGGYGKKLILVGNPICDHGETDASYCTISDQSTPTYSTPNNNCLLHSCPSDQNLSPNCSCAYPYTGTIYLRSPSFSNLENVTYYHILEGALLKSFQSYELPVDSVALHDPLINSYNNVNITLQVFPAGKVQFSQSDVSRLGFMLSNQTFKPPSIFGPYYFIAMQYDAFPVRPVEGSASKSNKLSLIVGAAVGAAAVTLICLAVFAIRRKRKPENVVVQTQPFESWDPTKGSGGVPQLQGARWFSFGELKSCTNNFSEANEIGIGGYGKVYRGTLEKGLLVAIKRAQRASMQGGLEFKTEIELLSRVHHKNLVTLIGFCFEQGEQMLVYEYFPNGSLRECLLGMSGIRLDWKRRLRVALGSARGIAYLHELANPPIVHRDIKSSNILLDDRLNAKVSDFGLSKLLSGDEKGHITTQVKGTVGYLDPEYYMTQQLTEKSDVYSFGVCLLELITARKPIVKGKYIVREIRILMEKTKDLYGLNEILDPALGSSTILGGFEHFVNLAMKCVEESGTDRPNMSEVVRGLESIMQLSGLNPNSETSLSSSSYGETSKGHSHHPYCGDGIFDYSGGGLSSKVEPQ